MEAVFQLSGFQYRASEGDIVRVPRQKAKAGDTLEIPDVLLVKDKDSTLIGTPNVEGAKIEAEMMGEGRGEKVVVFKKRRRTKYRRTRGHRQDFSEIKITKIITAG
jgi:large subunit ribosomal protein L21